MNNKQRVASLHTKWWDAEDSNLVLPLKRRVHRRLCLHPKEIVGQERLGRVSTGLFAASTLEM